MYGNNIEAVLSDLEKNEIVAISLSKGIPSYERTLKIAEHSEMVVPGFGINPHNASEAIGHLDIMREYASQCIVLGEIGLDHFLKLTLLPFHYRKSSSQSSLRLLSNKMQYLALIAMV